MNFTLTTANGPSPHMVTLFAGGKRIFRKFFKSEKKAKDFIRESTREEDERISAGKANPRWAGGVCGVNEAIAEYLKWCESRNVRPRTRAGYEERLKAFAKFVGNVNVHGITRADVVNFATQPQCKSIWTQKGYRSDVASFLQWCSERGWCGNDFTKIKLDNVLVDEKPIAFLSVDEAEQFLDACSPNQMGRLALQLFSGLRPLEACRLGSGDVNLRLGRIHVPGVVAKGRKSRTLNGIPDNLREWIGKFPFEVCTYTAWASAKRRAVGAIGHDALRHSFCSYGYWVLGQEKCLRFTGHNDHTVFHRHYVENSVDEQDAERYFSLLP